MRGVKTDNKTIAKIMVSYALTNSYNATAKELGISDSTVKKVINQNGEEFKKVQEQKKELFQDKANRIIDKALKRLEEDIDNKDKNIPTSHLSTIIGTLYDKQALAKGESTSNNNIIITMSSEVKELSK